MIIKNVSYRSYGISLMSNMYVINIYYILFITVRNCANYDQSYYCSPKYETACAVSISTKSVNLEQT